MSLSDTVFEIISTEYGTTLNLERLFKFIRNDTIW